MIGQKKCSCEHAEEHGNQVLEVLTAFDRLRTTLSVSNLAVALQGAEVRPVRTGAVSTQVSGSAGRVMGWSFRETAGGNATLYLRDGRDASADVVTVIQLGAHESTRDSYFPGGLSFVQGLYLDVAVGAIEGSVYLGGAA